MSVIAIVCHSGMLNVLDYERVIPALRTWKAAIAGRVPAFARRLSDA